MPEAQHLDPRRGSQPERPSVEPEILPPGAEPSRIHVSAWTFEGTERAGRVFLARPGPFAFILALLLIGFVAAIVLVILLGLVVLWIPILIIALIAALFSSSLRRFWSGRPRGSTSRR
jgi:hypothetical protein